MTNRFVRVFVIALAGALFAAMASPADAVEVEVKFSKFLTKAMPRIDVVEREREEYFRRYRQTRRHSRELTTVRWPAVQWADELLIPDLDDYSVEALIRGLVSTSLERAGVKDVGRVEITVKRLRVQGHSMVKISGRDSIATGSITAYDLAGKVIGTADVSAHLITRFQAAPRYNGTDFAFPDTARRLRVGPTLAQFVYKSLGKIFPGKEFARPVMITY